MVSSEAGEDGTPFRVEEARKAHARGWLLLPLKGKRANLKGWSSAPPPSESQAVEWAEQGNVGLRTGAVSGVVVVDDDTDDGRAAQVLSLPKTVTVRTGSGRLQYYFHCPDGAVRNSTSRLAPKVDVRGDGGYVVCVGSVHPDTDGIYRWEPGLSPDEVSLAEIPPVVLDLMRNKQAPPAQDGSGEHRDRGDVSARRRRWARGALARAVKALASAGEGTRNDCLNREAFRLGRIIGAGLLARDQVEDCLRQAALGVGLQEQEVEATLRSGLDAGAAEPLAEEDMAKLEREARKDRSEEGMLGGGVLDRNRPSIFLEGGKLHEHVDSGECVILAAAGLQVYQRGTQLVRIMRSSISSPREGFRRSPGALIISEVEPMYLVEQLTKHALWLRWNASIQDYKPVDCPERVVSAYLARKGQWRVPVLSGIVEAPTLRADGSILSTPGYDAATGVFYDPGDQKFLEIPEHPTRDDAVHALSLIQALIKAFPFVADSDRATAIAAICTALVRRSLRSAPLFAFRAPKMGSGKSLLADVIAMIATGRVASVMTQGKDEDEDRKRMLAILLEGEEVCCIDNIERPFGGAALCSVLTQEFWKDRVLGKTGMATVPTATTWLATGNNLTFTGDITTRVLVSDLDPKVERPEERRFDVNLYEYVPEHRHELVPAALTILRAHDVAGRPDQGLSVFGRFEEWSNWIRSALVWCGEADACEGRKRIEETDPVRRDLQAVFHFWWDMFQSQPITTIQLMTPAMRAQAKETDDFYQALVAVSAGRGGQPDSRKLGHWLTRNVDRIEGGFRLERVGNRQGVALWRLNRVDGGPGGSEGLVGSSQPVGGDSIPPRSSPNAGGPEVETRSGPEPMNPPNPQNPPRRLSFFSTLGGKAPLYKRDTNPGAGS